MHRAIRPGGDIAELERARACGCRVDAVDERGRTALYMAAAAGRIDQMEWLLLQGADASMAASDGRTPLHAAAAAGQHAAVKMLIEVLGEGFVRACAAVDGEGQTPGELAYAAQDLVSVRALLDAMPARL